MMKDSYSLDGDNAGLERQYSRHLEAYRRIFDRLALPVTVVESDTGMMGGHGAHEFMYRTPIGEDTIITCSNCGYSANQQVARFRKEPAADPVGARARAHAWRSDNPGAV
jgi:prolyl-tRNA synthetase